MAGAIKIYTTGHSGVIIDQSPLEPGVPDDSFQIAQNMTHDPQAGKGGAVCKRPGLAKFNLIGMGGVILGGIPMPVAGLGGAPAVGGGSLTGDSTGTGDGTGGMGGTFDGGAVTYGSVGASIFGGGSGGSGNIFSGKRLIVIGYSNTATTNDGVGWYVTSKQLADTALTPITPGPAGVSAAAPLGGGETIAETAGVFLGRVFAITADNWLYYVKAATIIANVPHQIRRTNGAVDEAVGTIPNNTLTVGGGSIQFQSVSVMTYGEDGNIYFATVDEYGSTNTGRIMKVKGGIISNLSTIFPSTVVPYEDVSVCMETFEGRLFWGTIQKLSDTSAQINCLLLSDDAALAIDDFRPTADQRYSGFTCMLRAGGVLYAGTRVKTAGVAQNAVILVREPGKAIGDAAAWNVNDVISLDPALPVAVDRNCWVSFAYFNDVLYASWCNPTDRATIYKLTPGTVAGLQGFVTASSGVSYTSTAAADRVAYELFVDDGVLYAIGQRNETTARKFMWTTDGVTWTDATANFSLGNKFPHPILFGLDQ
jgi:hypothetical protein